MTTLPGTSRDGVLVRAQMGDYELRDAADGTPTLYGHFAKFDQWTEINSGWEGNFMERIAPGAFRKTIADNGANMRVLFNHGHDVMGDQVLGKIDTLREDSQGAYYEVGLFPSVPPLIQEGLRAGQYGASFRFRVLREEVNDNPGASDYNPRGIPERTIKEADVMEFGPVTFPAYAGATAGVRSMTDEYLAERIGTDKLRDLILDRELTAADVPTEPTSETEVLNESSTPEREAPSQDDADLVTSSEERREAPEPTTETRSNEVNPNASLDELRARDEEIGDELQRLDADAGTGFLSEGSQARWDALVAEQEEIRKQITAKEARLSVLDRAKAEKVAERVAEPGFNVITRHSENDIYDLSTVRGAFDNPQAAAGELRERAMHSIERSLRKFADNSPGKTQEDHQGHVEKLVRGDMTGEISRRILATGHPEYEDAFFRKITGRPTTRHQDELLERALALATTGYAMPVTLDPTVLLTSNGAVNPLRSVARVVQISGQTWNGVNSAGVSASFDAEASEVSDDAPTLTQPTVTTLKAQAFVPFSVESEQWSDIRNELAREIADAKDVLEASKFTVGTGTPEPQGVMVGATNLATTAATATIALADIDTLMDALPPRFQARAVLLANRKFFSKVRQLSRTAGVNDQWPNVAPGTPGTVNGVPAYECSDIVSTLTTSASLVAAYGDFNAGFLIVDSIGMNVEYVPTMFHTSNNRPSGQRGLHAWWMTNSVVRSVAPLRLLKVL